MWIPFEMNKKTYILVYFYQSLRVCCTGTGTIGHDILIFALSMRVCHQIELLKHRLKVFSDNAKDLSMKSIKNWTRYDSERILFELFSNIYL